MENPSIIGNLKPQTKIYRIFPRRYFFELFGNRKNTLVLPEKWDDPFENVFLKARVENTIGEHGFFSFRNEVYGQCWTLQSASNAIWQIYSRNKNAIRVRTTVGALIESLRAVNGQWANANCFIGRIKYQSDKQLVESGKTVFRAGNPSHMIARSLLIKRMAYKHENEVRLIYIEPGKTIHADGLYKYEIEPTAIFDQVMVDGRVPYEEFVVLKNRIAKRTGLSKHRIKRSLLYTSPRGFVVCIP